MSELKIKIIKTQEDIASETDSNRNTQQTNKQDT